MSETVLTTLTQFGAAGLIGILWILERRQSATRNRQLDEAHERIRQDGQAMDALLTVVKENTRAIIRLERSQSRLIALLEHLPGRQERPGEGGRLAQTDDAA
jgi:hypothetical protein